jgi:hypothetical protein
MERRRIFVSITNVVKEAFDRDQRWNREDLKKCDSILDH